MIGWSCAVLECVCSTKNMNKTQGNPADHCFSIFLVKSYCTYGVLTANLCVAHQHCILGEFHVSIITITAQAPHNSNIQGGPRYSLSFCKDFSKNLFIYLFFMHDWLYHLCLWLSKSIYLYHRRCAQRSWKCSVRQNNNLAHRGAADTKLISVLNQVVCVQGQLDSYLT